MVKGFILNLKITREYMKGFNTDVGMFSPALLQKQRTWPRDGFRKSP